MSREEPSEEEIKKSELEAAESYLKGWLDGANNRDTAFAMRDPDAYMGGYRDGLQERERAEETANSYVRWPRRKR